MRSPIIKTLVALTALACLPSAAAARPMHTGWVTCDTRGVVFSYNPNFERDTLVTETVGGAIRVETVQRHKAKLDIWAGVTGTVTAGAKWKGGSIRTVTLTCPAPDIVLPPPAPVAPPTPPAAPAPAAPPVALPVAPPVAPPAPPVAAPPAKCPKGYRLHVTHGTRLCLRTIIKRPRAPRCDVGERVKVLSGWVICRVKVPAARPPSHHASSVTG